MIIDGGGGKGGFKEYLETGQKKGRDIHRDQLDQRIPLLGDLNVFEIATSTHEGEGRRYDHITLSFSEHHVSDQMLQVVAEEFRDHALAAWQESERHRIAIYAEAHRPKILSYTNSETGEHVERFIHVHFGLGRHDLKTGEAIEPLGFLGPQTDNLKFIDAFQESFNSRYGFASPKDNPKITPENAVDTLARYTGARPDALGTFNERKAALEVILQKEIISRNVTTWDGFEEVLVEHGTVSKMNRGKFNECYRVKPHGADKAMRLTGVFFQQQFIRRPTTEKLDIISEKAKTAYLEQMQPRKEPEYVARVLHEWHQTKAREHRYLHTGSHFYRDVYKPADAETRRQILDQLERKSHAITSPVPSQNRKNPPNRGRVPGMPERNMDGISRRSKMLLRDHDDVDVRTGPGSEEDRLGMRQAGEPGSGNGIATNIQDRRDDAGADAGSSSDTPSHGITPEAGSAGQPVRGYGQSHAGRTGRAGELLQPSSVVAKLQAGQRERYERAADKEKYAEIRKNLDCSQLLASLSHSHGLNPDLYQVSVGKDGAPRIRCGSRALTPSDFLTKEMGLPWREAAPILRETYQQQIGSKTVKPRSSKAAPSKLWREFKAEQQAGKPGISNRLKLFDDVAKKRRAALFEKLMAEQKTTLAGMSGPARKAAHSLQKLRMATAKANLSAMLKEERESLRPTQANAWRFFLQARAQSGNEEALAELRKLDDTARAAPASTPAITGTLILDDEEEKKRRRRAGESATFILKSLTHMVERNGDVTFHQHGRAILRDEGRHLAVLDENSEEAIAAGLLIAREKFGSNLTLTGSLEFQRRVVEVAVAQGIAVKFVNPQLEALRQQIMAEKRHAQHAAKMPTPKAPSKQNPALTPDALEPSNNQQAQRAAAAAAEEVAEQIDADTHQAEITAPLDPATEWFAANLDMVESKTPPLLEGRVLHIFDDGRWVQHLGREQAAIRQPVAFKLEAGQMVSFDKHGKPFIVPEKEKNGRAG